MSACIYHDAEAVAVCSGCDFGVCQHCMDEGSDGVCSTCAEERTMRREHSALQREYSVEEQVPRCSYCRAAADEDTPLDEQGYCPSCTTLARCSIHGELIAVGHCTSCRKEHCRKCLGFTNVCQICTAKKAVKPAKAPPPAAGARGGKTGPKTGTGGMKAGTGGMKAGTGKIPPGKATGKTGPLKGGKGSTSDLRGKGEPGEKKAPRKKTRGEIAVEERLGRDAPSRVKIIGASVTGAVICLALLSGMWLHAATPQDQAKQAHDQMVSVHRGVLDFYHRSGHLPQSADEIKSSLASLGVKNARRINVAVSSSTTPTGFAPNSVIFRPRGGGFIILAADRDGNAIKGANGAPIVMDQYYDSSSQ